MRIDAMNLDLNLEPITFENKLKIEENDEVNLENETPLSVQKIRVKSMFKTIESNLELE